MIDVDPEPYSDNFARPARLLPVEAKALIAAIDLIGDHLPEGALNSAREKIVAALGADPMEQGLQVASGAGDDSEIARVVSRAISDCRLLRLEYYKANEDEFSERVVEPYALINGREGWYVASYDPAREAVRHFRLDRVKTAEVLDVALHAATRGRPRRRRRRLAAHRPGRGLPRRPRLDLARARPLVARAAPRRPGARRRLGRSSSCPTRAPTGSCARCWPRPATPPSSRRRRPARPSARPSIGCSSLSVRPGPTRQRGFRPWANTRKHSPLASVAR